MHFSFKQKNDTQFVQNAENVKRDPKQFRMKSARFQKLYLTCIFKCIFFVLFSNAEHLAKNAYSAVTFSFKIRKIDAKMYNYTFSDKKRKNLFWKCIILQFEMRLKDICKKIGFPPFYYKNGAKIVIENSMFSVL